MHRRRYYCAATNTVVRDSAGGLCIRPLTAEDYSAGMVERTGEGIWRAHDHLRRTIGGGGSKSWRFGVAYKRKGQWYVLRNWQLCAAALKEPGGPLWLSAAHAADAL